jgi:L-iditol 2-dehydrogenase
MSATTVQTNGHAFTGKLKPNIGVYTDPEHNLYISEASPSVEELENGDSLDVGEVVVQVRHTGICG